MKNSPIIEPTADSRQHYFDFLRVIAAFSIIVSHTHDARWPIKGYDITSFDWNVFVIYNGLSSWPVPVFVMISGALFLSRDIPLRRIFSRNIFRMCTAFLFWTCIYAAKELVKTHSISHALSLFVHPYLHLWFVPFIAGMYMLVPVMKKITESESLTKYVLALWFIFSVLIPSAVKLMDVFAGDSAKFVKSALTIVKISSIGAIEGCFLLGYFLNTADISPKTERVIYSAGIAAFVISIVMNITASRMKGYPVTVFTANTLVFVLFESIAVFVFFKRHFNQENKTIRILSDYSFGIYLAHFLAGSFAKLCGLTSTSFNTVFSVPVMSAVIFGLSFISTWILKRIPVLKKYVV